MAPQQTHVAQQVGRQTLCSPPTALRLQVLDGSSPNRIVRVSARRCTVGGAPSCTVRLRAFGVRPFHCLIQQSAGRTRVRSLCPGNQLNGLPFRQERLQDGDTLTLGPITFRVLLDHQARVLPSAPLTAGAQSTAPASDAPETAVDELPEAVLARIERLENQLAELERRAEAPPAESAESVPPSLFDNLMAELAQQREDLGRQRLEWASERQRLDQLLTDRMGRLAELEAQLLAQQQNRRELEESFDHARNRLAELEEALEQSRQRLHSEQQEHGEQRNAWDTLRSHLEAELAASRRQWAELVQQVESFQQQSQQDRDNWQAAEARLAEVRRCLEELSAQFQGQQSDFQHQSALWLDQKQRLETQLEAALQRAEQERLEQAAALEHWQGQCRELEARLASQQAVVAQQQQQLADLDSLRDRLLQQCGEQQGTIEQLASRCSQQDTDAARVIAETAEQEQQWERQRAEFLQQQSQWELERARLLDELEAHQRRFDEQQTMLERIEAASQEEYRQWEVERCRLLEQLQQATAAQESYAQLNPLACDAERLLPALLAASSSNRSEPDADGLASASLAPAEDVLPGQHTGIPQVGESLESTEPTCETEIAECLVPPVADDSESWTGADFRREAAEDTPLDRRSFDGVKAQLQELGVWRDAPREWDMREPSATDTKSEAAELSTSSVLDEVVADTESPVSREPRRGAGDEDESIESYMNQLLVRLRGPSAWSGYVYAPPPEAPRPEDRPPITESKWCAPSPVPADESEEAADFRPRSQAPEVSADLAAMRALANDSARTAIATHKRQSLYYQVFLNMLGALVAMVVCACFINQFRHDSLLTNVCVTVALFAGGFGLTKYILYRRQGPSGGAETSSPGEWGTLHLPAHEWSAVEPERTAEFAATDADHRRDVDDTHCP